MSTCIKKISFLLIGIFWILELSNTALAKAPAPVLGHPVIIFVWDGLRPDAISKQNTPHLYALAHAGTYFADNHSSYPTFTMMNAASFATGDFSGQTGFYGNTLWNPKAYGTDSSGATVDFKAPVFTEDYRILQDLNQGTAGPLLGVNTLFNIAHTAGLTTAAVGKSGPAFMQDHAQSARMEGIVVDERHVYPLAFAKALQQSGYPLPNTAPKAFPPGSLTLSSDNANPTSFGPVTTLKTLSSQALGNQAHVFSVTDGVTSDPTATAASPYAKANAYLMQTYLEKVLPLNPMLSVIWLRNPDTTEHNYGVGSASYVTALRAQDALLAQLEARLKALHLWRQVDLIVVSDHGHSNVSGPLSLFPLRGIQNGMVTTISPKGYSVSGDFRPADWLARAGFNAYDGAGCQYDPVLSGILASGKLVYPIQTDTTGARCGLQDTVYDLNGHRATQMGRHYTTPAYWIPNPLPNNAIIVANNGGSTYFYVPSHNPVLVEKLVRTLQSQEVYGAIFVDDRYGNVPGTLPLSLVKLENSQGRNPDVIAGSHYDATALINGVPGIEFNSGGSDRGMHGSFSPIDVHNTLIAYGPDFKKHFVDTLPTGNVDVPVTVAYLLRLNMPDTAGRPLREALSTRGLPLTDFVLTTATWRPKTPATGLRMVLPTNPNGTDRDPGKSHYSMTLQTSVLTVSGSRYWYFDSATAQRY